MKPYLRVESIWEDGSTFEVRVSASNGAFSGVANCYSEREEMEEFARLMEGFPQCPGQELSLTTGESGNLSYFTLMLRSLGGSGHVIARIKISHIAMFSNAEKEHDSAEFDFKVEPAAIDDFSRSLRALAKSDLGEVKAELSGIT